MNKILALSAVVLVFSACIKRSGAPAAHAGRSPDEVVRSFIELSTTAKEPSDRKKLQELCLGELRRTFERMNDEAFRLIYLDTKVAVLEFKVVESSMQGETAKIHYQVMVDNKQGTDPTRELNSREVDLTRSQGAWYIESIRMKGSDQVAFTRGMLF